MSEARETLTTRFLTYAREDLFEVSRRLIRGIDEAFLKDPQKPVIVTVDGSYSAGKKIFPDAARTELFKDAQNTGFYGKKEFDEYWFSKDKALELDFVNLAWGEGYKHIGESAGVWRKYNDFLSHRKYGGISFIHNSYRSIQKTSDIQIYLDDGKKEYAGEIREEIHDHLKAQFNRAAHKNDWLRYVEVGVSSQRLKDSPRFLEQFNSLSSISQKNRVPEKRTFSIREKMILAVKKFAQMLDDGISLPGF